MNEPTQFIITLDLANKITAYLGNQPYNQTHELIEGIQGQYKAYASVLEQRDAALEAEMKGAKQDNDGSGQLGDSRAPETENQQEPTPKPKK